MITMDYRRTSHRLSTIHLLFVVVIFYHSLHFAGSSPSYASSTLNDRRRPIRDDQHGYYLTYQSSLSRDERDDARPIHAVIEPHPLYTQQEYYTSFTDYDFIRPFMGDTASLNPISVDEIVREEGDLINNDGSQNSWPPMRNEPMPSTAIPSISSESSPAYHHHHDPINFATSPTRTPAPPPSKPSSPAISPSVSRATAFFPPNDPFNKHGLMRLRGVGYQPSQYMLPDTGNFSVAGASKAQLQLINSFSSSFGFNSHFL